MIRRNTVVALAATLVGLAAVTATVLTLQPVGTAGTSASQTATAPGTAGREGGFDGPRSTASPTATPTAAPPAPAPAPPAPEPEAPPVPPGADPAEADVLALTNAERAANGCGPLAWDDALAQVARLHSADMAARDYFDHTNPEGLSPFDRAAAAGTSANAENIAAGQGSAADVMASWMSSPGHRANILNCGLTRLGVGVGHGGSYGITWTQLFGS
jgi:uncharacterized protein YkwD